MSKRPDDVRQLGFYYALGQVGLEMALPAGLGLWIDSTWNTGPWAVIIGAILGLVLGMLHLVVLLNQQQQQNQQTKKTTDSSKTEQDTQ